MIQIAIVEDEKEYSDQLTSYLKQYEQEKGQNFEITAFSDGDGILKDYHAQFDIILMDVEMRFVDGMSAAEEIRKVDAEVVIIFITNMAQYAIRGYAVDALDYVLKPVSYFAFSQRLQRAIGRMKKRETKTISLSTKNGVVRIDVADICFVESQGHTIFIHKKNEVLEMSGTMKNLEEQLSGESFFRGNKGYLINLAHVESVKDGCAIVNDNALVLSRARKKDFMEALTGYWGGVAR